MNGYELIACLACLAFVFTTIDKILDNDAEVSAKREEEITKRARIPKTTKKK
jgi:hypothetical protein